MARTRVKIPKDPVIREYAEHYASDLAGLANLGPEYKFDRLASAHLRASCRRADLVAILKNAEGVAVAVHIELQAYHDVRFGERMLDYNTRIRRREKCEVVSIAIYLTPRASASRHGGSFTFGNRLTGGSFWWQEVHAHELSLEDERVRQCPGLLPLVVAAARDVTQEKVVEVVNTLRGRLAGDDEKRQLMVTLDTFAATRFGLTSSLWPLEQEKEMEHIFAQSPYGQKACRRAREEGCAKGRSKERLTMLKSMVEAMGASWRSAYSEAGARLSESAAAELMIRASRETDRGLLQRMLDEALGDGAKANSRARSLKTG